MLVSILCSTMSVRPKLLGPLLKMSRYFSKRSLSRDFSKGEESVPQTHQMALGAVDRTDLSWWLCVFGPCQP